MLSISEKDQSIIISIIESINKIKVYTEHLKSAEDFNNNNQPFDATIMNFIVIGEMVSKFSVEFKSYYNEIDWINIVGFRNIIAHDYFGIDADEIWEIIQKELPVLEDFLTKF